MPVMKLNVFMFNMSCIIKICEVRHLHSFFLKMCKVLYIYAPMKRHIFLPSFFMLSSAEHENSHSNYVNCFMFVFCRSEISIVASGCFSHNFYYMYVQVQNKHCLIIFI